MLMPLPQSRFRAVSMDVVGHFGEPNADIVVRAEDGAAIVIECTGSAISDLQRQIRKIARDQPDLTDWQHAGGLLGPPPESGTEKPSVNVTSGNAAGSLAVGSDVTERIKAQRENVESRRIFEDLFENSDAAIIDHDFSLLFRAVQDLKRNGVSNLRRYVTEADGRLERLVEVVHINNANATALRMLGLSSLQQIGKPTINIFDIAEAMFNGDTRIRRSEYLVSGGTPIPVVYSLRIPRTEEEARRVPIVIMDLSDIKLAEAARQATLAKSQFLSSMSHEIRTPLNGVIGNLELLALTNLDNEQFELIDDADKAAKTLLGLVGNILDFSKIEAGKLTTEIGDINPAALVEEAVDVLQSRARQKKTFVTATFGTDVPSLVRGDAMRVRQILLNLISNAVKFTEEGGVQVSLTVTAWNRDVCELRFQVTDSGRGFDQIQVARLFEPFTQDRPSVNAEEGTGLGLSICKSLVNAFGGTIGCEGVPGEGATFWFTLPVAVVKRAPAVGKPDLSGKKVVLIGTDDLTTQALKTYFEARGAKVAAPMHWDAMVPPPERNSDGRSQIDIAVLVPDGRDPSEWVGWLQHQHIVPLLYGADLSVRACLRQGFAAVIPRDMSADHLDRNIRLLAGHAQARDRLVAQQEAAISALGPDLRGTHVLVLEDRLVNQTVIQKQLKKLGVECTLVVNGIQGLEMLDRRPFDLILCDCSMPEMNGYEFTRALRTREAAPGGPRRVPVIALTANAFREDADKCSEAGMDDFISKPVTMDRLSAMLVRWLSPASTAPMAAPTSPRANIPEQSAIDLDALTEMLGGSDADSIDEVLAEFSATVEKSLGEVEEAVSSGEWQRIRLAAHGAKGEARCAAATALGDIYAGIEDLTKDGDLDGARGLAVNAAAEAHRVRHFIQGRLGVRLS